MAAQQALKQALEPSLRHLARLFCSRAWSGAAPCPRHGAAALQALIELEAERCSLDSLGAFTDEHYCGPAVTQSMHSDDTYSQMWVGSGRGLTSKASSSIYSNLHRDPTGKNQRCRCLLLHFRCGSLDR